MEPAFKLTREGVGPLMLVDEEGGAREVKAARLFPLTNPTQHIVLNDTDGNEIHTLKELSELDPESMQILSAELDRSYFLPRIKHIVSLSEVMGILKFSVDTDKGPRRFEVRSRDDIRYIRHGQLQILLKDIDGNRFEIWDASRMDSRSRSLMDRFL